jgi:hypothetical protein
VDILVDVHTIDALATDHALDSYLGNLDSLTIYSSIMKKYNTNGESFKATMQWYSARPEKLSEVYDEVFGKLTKMNQELSDQLKLFNQPGAKLIFQQKAPLIIKGDTANYPEPFLCKLEGPGTYLIDIQLRLFTGDKSSNPQLLAYFTKNSEDLVASERIVVADLIINKSTFSRNFQFVAELKDGTYQYLKLFVPKTDDSIPNVEKDFQLSMLKVKKVPPPLITEENKSK